MQVTVTREEQQVMDEVLAVVQQLSEEGKKEFRAIMQGMQIGISAKIRA